MSRPEIDLDIEILIRERHKALNASALIESKLLSSYPLTLKALYSKSKDEVLC
jgi:hypothetical protein